MDTSTAEIESTIREKRESLRSNIGELSHKVKEAADWKHYYREHTGSIIAVAFSAGLLVAVLGARRSSSPMRARVGDRSSRPGGALPGDGASLNRRGHEVFERWDSIKRALVGVAASQVTGLIGRLIPGFRDHLQNAAGGSDHLASKARDVASRL
jgi:hypothetical protein